MFPQERSPLSPPDQPFLTRQLCRIWSGFSLILHCAPSFPLAFRVFWPAAVRGKHPSQATPHLLARNFKYFWVCTICSTQRIVLPTPQASERFVITALTIGRSPRPPIICSTSLLSSSVVILDDLSL